MKPPISPTKILVMKNNPPVKSLLKTYCAKAICIFFLALFSETVFSQPCTPPIVDAPTVTQPTCASPSGTVIIFASGVSALEYSINGTVWQASNTFSNLNPGVYTVIVRLASNTACTASFIGNPVLINAIPVPPIVNAPTVTQPNCTTPKGTIVVNATGVGTLDYSIDNGATWQTSNTFPNLDPGNYNIVVRLQSNPTCVTPYSGNPVVINAAPTPPTINAPDVTQPTCAVPTGTIVINGSGTGAVEYSIDGTTWQTSNTFSGLLPGNYTVSIRLQGTPSCITPFSGNPVVIGPVPTAPTINLVDITQPTCGATTGTITSHCNRWRNT